MAEAGVFGRAHPQWGEAVTARDRAARRGRADRRRAARVLRRAARRLQGAEGVRDGRAAPAHRLWQAAAAQADMTDPDDYRKESRARWGRQARGWGAQAERLAAATMPVSVWMVDALDLQPGHEVLELAAGTGEVGFLAAEQIAARRHAHLLRLRARDDHGRAGARGAARDHQRPLPPDRRRVDRPAGRLARRRAVPLGLHADGRRRGGAARDAPHPAPRRARGAGGLDGPGREPVGVAPVARAGGPRPHGAARPRRPGPVRVGAQRDHRGAPQRRGLRRARGRRRRLHPGLPLLRRLDRRPSASSRAASARRSTASTRPSATTSSRRVREQALPYVQEDGSLALPARTWVAVASA